MKSLIREAVSISISMIGVDVIILAGGPRMSQLELSAGIPLFRLPIDQTHSLLSAWKLVVGDVFSKVPQMQPRSWMVLLSKARSFGTGIDLADVEAVYEPRSHRGTAGTLLDHFRRVRSDAPLVLVIELSACPAVHLDNMFSAWRTISEEPLACVIGESSLRRYCGVTLCSRSVFDFVPEVGFFDFKEQLLPAVRSAGGVIEARRVADRARRVRTRPEWLDAVQAWQDLTSRSEEVVGDCGPNLEEGESDRSVISRTALTAGARVVSSIVMDEAVVEPGALVARSIIGPGMRVSAGTRVIDGILADPAVGEATIRRSGASGTVSVASE